MQAQSLTTLLLPAAATLALAPLASAGGGNCAKPGMDVSPSGHPYGPVDPGDGTIDRIDIQTDIPLDLRFSLEGLDHDDSLTLGNDYLTLGLYSPSPAEVPFVLNPCSTFWVPTNSPYVVVPSSLEVPTQIDNPTGFIGWQDDVWFQTLSVEIADPSNIQMSDLVQLRMRQGPLVDDPTTDKQYNCYYWGHYAWNEGNGAVQGRVYWPDNCDGDPDPAFGTHPLVVIVHGDGHSYTDYTYLARHLAFNGYIVASVDGGQEKTNVERAERVNTYLNFLFDHWEYRTSIANNIALMGHSRGGEAVLTTARKLNEWGTPYDVNAVIALAPTDSDGNGGTEGLESLSSSDSESLLVIYGSMDEDVAGYCTDGNAPDCGIVPGAPQRTGFSIYDRAGGEYSTEGIFLAGTAITKAMLFVDRADHNRWREGCIDPNPFAIHKPLGCDEHHDILRGYVNAFLHWQLDGDDEYKPFFTGEWMPPTVRAHGVQIAQQYSERGGRRVIDNFESGAWNDGTLSTVQNDLQVTVVKKGSLYDYGNHTIPHDTNGMILRWSGHPFAVDPFVRWTVNAGSGFGVGPYRDFSGKSTLSVRLGQVDGGFGNNEGETTTVWARLRDGQGNVSPNVWLDAFTDLSYPHQSVVLTPLLFTKETAKSSMRTARVPLEYFTGVDLSDVVDIELVFGDNGDLQGEIVIDNLEVVL